jgi:hypothetical protein
VVRGLGNVPLRQPFSGETHAFMRERSPAENNGSANGGAAPTLRVGRLPVTVETIAGKSLADVTSALWLL